MRHHSSWRELLIGLLACLGFLALGYAFFVCTPWGQTWDFAGYFGREPGGRFLVEYDHELLSLVQKRVILIAAGVVFLIALIQWKPVTGVAAVGAMGIAITGAEFLKRTLPRPALIEPWGTVPAYFSQDTYPSGHTTVGTSVVFALLLVLPRAVRPVFAVIAAILSASYATGVLFAGWHRPADSVGGILWTGFCFGLAVLLIRVVLSRQEREHFHQGHWAFPVTAAAGILAVI